MLEIIILMFNGWHQHVLGNFRITYCQFHTSKDAEFIQNMHLSIYSDISLLYTLSSAWVNIIMKSYPDVFYQKLVSKFSEKSKESTCHKDIFFQKLQVESGDAIFQAMIAMILQPKTLIKSNKATRIKP